MACFHPLAAYQQADGSVKFGRVRAISDRAMKLPCTQCTGCRLEKSRQWAVRIMHEAATHEKNCFITLTYDETHLPRNKSLDLEHWQYFAKRSRKYLSNKNETEGTDEKFRFFHCGEYGEKHRRPHYHAAIFGQDYSEDRKYLKKTDNGDKLYTSALLSKLWPYGLPTIGSLTFESAAYVARYIMTKRTGPTAEEHYETMDPDTGERIQLKPEYCTMSRRPGLGAKWIETFQSDVYPSDEVIVNGRSCRPPKYYDLFLEKKDPNAFKKIRLNRIEHAKQYEDNNTEARLLVREEIKIARIRYLAREL